MDIVVQDLKLFATGWFEVLEQERIHMQVAAADSGIGRS